LQHDLIVDDRVRIPRSELVISYARSSGPGGQNVNKVSTKAIVRWNAVASGALPDDVRARLLSVCANRLTTTGELVIASDRHREQGRNLSDCLQRLRALVLAAATPPTVRRATRKPRGANEARLREKRAQSTRKGGRRAPDDGD
jgi:ribosome-associated protein